jgi:hypothetical protein
MRIKPQTPKVRREWVFLSYTFVLIYPIITFAQNTYFGETRKVQSKGSKDGTIRALNNTITNFDEKNPFIFIGLQKGLVACQGLDRQ